MKYGSNQFSVVWRPLDDVANEVASTFQIASAACTFTVVSSSFSAAVNGPIERYNSFYAAGRKRIFIEPELVEAVLDQVETDKVSLGDTGGGIRDD